MIKSISEADGISRDEMFSGQIWDKLGKRVQAGGVRQEILEGEGKGNGAPINCPAGTENDRKKPI